MLHAVKERENVLGPLSCRLAAEKGPALHCALCRGSRPGRTAGQGQKKRRVP